MAKKNESNDEVAMTKYEKARIIGSRALQLESGAPFLIKLSKKKLEEIKYNPLRIAKLEFDAGVIPITVKRTYPDTRTAPEEDKKPEE